MTAFGMPSRRMRAVSARVSTPQMPMIPRAFSQASSRRVARKFEGSLTSARRIDAARAGRGRQIDGLDVLLVGSDDADMRKGEGDDLPGVGGVGEDFLVAGHRRVEADFADRFAGRAEAKTFDDEPVRQHDQRGALQRRPSCMARRRCCCV